jgi:hypothetical protein
MENDKIDRSIKVKQMPEGIFEITTARWHLSRSRKETVNGEKKS